jgi:hypothetical protein
MLTHVALSLCMIMAIIALLMTLTRLFFIGSGLDLNVFDICFLMLSLALSSYIAHLP